MKIISYLIIILLPTFLILLNFRLLIFNRGFYQNQLATLGVYQNFNNRQEVNEQLENLLNYYCCTESLSTNFFTPLEITHLEDVKSTISLANFQLAFTTSAAFILILVLATKGEFKYLGKSLIRASLATIAAVLILWISYLLNFSFIFDNFHKIIFKSNLWQLPPESNLIKLFPQQFFVNFANRIAYQTVIMAALIIIVAQILKGRK